MQPYPHLYVVHSSGSESGDVTLSSKALPDLATAPPAEFDGPGDKWSPETLLLGALADCYLLTFRAVARASKLSFSGMECTAEGKLDRVERVAKFTDIVLRATVTVSPEVEEAAVMRALEKAEKHCIISNSLEVRPRGVYEVRRAPK